MRKIYALLLFTFAFYLSPLSAQTGTWTVLKNHSLYDNGGVCLLMTDGTVICKNNEGPGYGTSWNRLTPDIHGSYINGTWDTIAPMVNSRLYFSTQVLPSGKVYVAGGEYGPGGIAGEVYDPVANTWALCGPIPSGWNIYDAPSELLYNGNILEAPEIGANGGQPCTSILQWDPTTLNYISESAEPENHDEATWLKLPDSSVLTVGMPYFNIPLHDSSCRYIPQTNTWLIDSQLANNIFDANYETGPAFLLPNGKAIFFGATQYNAIYTPTGHATPGTWAVAANFPLINGTYVGMPDAPGAMMVNGHILLAVAPIGSFTTPTYFVEYDYTTNTFTQVKDTLPRQGGDSINFLSQEIQMLDLPDGNVLLSAYNNYYIYTPGSGPIPQGKPTINNIIPISCGFYKITGKLFNGISEGASFGDDWQMSTNYPIVRLINGSNVYYARSTNWNRIGAVATDSLEDTAYFALPSLPGGTYSVEVVVNGFASSPALLTTFGVAINAQTNVTCYGGNNGSATVFPADGVAPYTYTWTPNGGTNATAYSLSAGSYTVTVIGNGGGCSTSVQVNITQPTVLGVTTSAAINCSFGNTGSATAYVNGGVRPYTYSWTGGGTTATIRGLSAGNYTVTVNDSCGASATSSVTIIAYTSLSVSIDSVINYMCAGAGDGYANAHASGGLSPYTYSWSGGYGNDSDAFVFSAGTYTVTVSDMCGNSVTASATITQPPSLTVTMTLINNASIGPCDDEAYVSVGGGVPPYFYSWDHDPLLTDSIIIGLCYPGYFCCYVTDYNGCPAQACDSTTLTMGINNLVDGNDNLISVYPNPGKGLFNLIDNAQWTINNDNSMIEVYNALGEIVYSKFFIANFPLSIDLSSNPNGIYFYRAIKENGGLLGQGKIVIQK